MIPNVASIFSQITVHSVALLSSSASLGWVDPAIVNTLEDRTRDDFQNLSHTFFACVLVSAGVVAVGVAMEGPEIFHDLWPRLFQWFTRRSAEKLKKFERTVKKIGAIGWVLVAIGVAGEGVFELLQNRVEGQLQTFNDILLKDARLTAARAQVQAGDAATNAQLAQGSANKAGTSASLAQHHADEIGKELRGEIDQEQAAEKQIEDERVKRLKLAASLAPRQILDSTGIANELQSMSPRRVILVYADEREIKDLATQFAGVFTLLHWQFFRASVSEDDLSRLPDGVSVSFGQEIDRALKSDEEYKEINESWANDHLKESVAKAFSSHGVEVTPTFTPTSGIREPVSTMIVEIGRKPEKEAEDAIRELGPLPKPTPFTGDGHGIIAVRNGSIRTLRVSPIPPEPSAAKP